MNKEKTEYMYIFQKLIDGLNIMTMNQEGETTEYDHGYYSTGVFSKTNNNNRFNQFGEAQIGHGKYFYYGYGYYTPIESSILVPTLKKELDIYVLIKKWEGTNPPDEAWLSSDKDAVYTNKNGKNGRISSIFPQF